ncbi:hypothetical protein [Fusobacterium ulcerans]|uniref:hypothetical protein n=1 Tax=Fusobacterium ulcerans TaxID=861 RepID=UPI0026DBE87B|nr:hypothetical protein [Fusobacterium ulcerans]
MKNGLIENDDVFGELGELINQQTYQSTFNFESFEINEEDKKFIIEREEILYHTFKNYSKAEYDICKAIYEIKMKMKGDESSSFVAWYKHNQLTKDKVSEMLKRYELFIQAPDKIEYISSLSIPAVKALTKKDIALTTLDSILSLELRDMESINQKIYEDTVSESEKEDNKKIAIKSSYVSQIAKAFKKKINKSSSLTELAERKKEIIELENVLKEMKKEIEQQETERENEKNLNLFDEKLYEDENGYCYILPKENKFALCFTTDKKDFFEKVIGYHFEYDTFQAAEIAMSSLIPNMPSLMACLEKQAYIDDRGWVFFVRSGIGGNNFKAFYAKNVEDYKAGYRCHAVKSLHWRNSIKDAKTDLDIYAKSKKMKVLSV